MIRVMLYQGVDDAAYAVKLQLPKGGFIAMGEKKHLRLSFLFDGYSRQITKKQYFSVTDSG
ncbi:hypothetical protein GF1_19820 [Desulfolithobacter dissulfuricans]|uniref:Uncharacterized protein n=1 Tax=Desulfolithobacter dissulfuricans TaxID=2795293 RepID=A0A915UA51_9BACT|nr:hypothetical protein GF1_19820 [Desulfolithobacter dissulfuricans]